MDRKNIIAIVIAAGLILGAGGLIYADKNSADNSSGGDGEFYTRADIADIAVGPDRVNLYYVWLRGCPACAAQDRWLDEMKDKYPELNVYKFNIQTEARLLEELARVYDVPTTARGTVPANFIGDEYFIGFDPVGMEAKIKACLIEFCSDPKEKLQL